IDVRGQANVELDIEQREKKSPRAFCAPIEVPGRVMLVIQPIGGADDWRALFHEAGHTEHFANTSPDLPVESKRMGDNAVTEGWAFLLEHLTGYPPWLEPRPHFPLTRRASAGGSTSPARASLRARAPPSSSTPSGDTRRSSSTSSSCSRPTTSLRSGSGTSSSSATR